MRIFHVATYADWEAAQAAGRYTTSTRGRTLAEEGFIHASRGDQWQGVRDRFYADVTEPLVLLVIDTDLLTAPVVEEHVSDTEETFPHVYGAIESAAVVQALPLETASATVIVPTRPTAAAPRAVGRPPSADTFLSAFLAEVRYRAALGFVVLVTAGVVAAVLQATGAGDVATLAGMLVVIAAGTVGGYVLLRRRDRQRREASPSA